MLEKTLTVKFSSKGALESRLARIGAGVRRIGFEEELLEVLAEDAQDVARVIFRVNSEGIVVEEDVVPIFTEFEIEVVDEDVVEFFDVRLDFLQARVFRDLVLTFLKPAQVAEIAAKGVPVGDVGGFFVLSSEGVVVEALDEDRRLMANLRVVSVFDEFEEPLEEVGDEVFDLLGGDRAVKFEWERGGGVVGEGSIDEGAGDESAGFER